MAILADLENNEDIIERNGKHFEISSQGNIVNLDSEYTSHFTIGDTTIQTDVDNFIYERRDNDKFPGVIIHISVSHGPTRTRISSRQWSYEIDGRDPDSIISALALFGARLDWIQDDVWRLLRSVDKLYSAFNQWLVAPDSKIEHESI